MSKPSPQYRINYLFCKQKGHQTQKANMVCLNKDCVQNSLICSFCLEARHKGHSTKPLKHFLEELDTKYRSQQNIKIDAELEELQDQKFFLLNKIKQAVQNLAQNFIKIQQEVITTYDCIKSQILQRQAQKNRFAAFYNSMALEGKGDPKFQIQNYLQFEPIYSFNLTNDLQKFVLDTSRIFQQIKKNMIRKKKDHIHLAIKEKDLQISKQIFPATPGKFVVPKTIIQKGNVFSQSVINNKQNAGYLNTFLKDMSNKIRVKVIALPASARLVLGVAKKKDINDSNHQFPFKNTASSLWVDSKGKHEKATYNYIAQIQSGAIIDILIKKNHCKISSKSNICDFVLPDKQESVFFFCMEGICSIELTYPYTKY